MSNSKEIEQILHRKYKKAYSMKLEGITSSEIAKKLKLNDYRDGWRYAKRGEILAQNQNKEG